ncbi:MAG TPA: response regulator [Anaerolineales bacterium]|nr:response regulator [Anaerolineales bacterium]
MEKRNILIVEDQRDLARMLQAGLSAAAPATDVVNVPSAEEALLVASTRRFDVLIIDVILPGVSGFVLLERLKARQPEARTILITGSADYEIRKKVANAGADAFLFKPVELEDILDAISRFERAAAPPHPQPGDTPPEPEPEERLDDHLASLRRSLDAFSVLLLDDLGRTLVQAGDLPPGLDPQILYPALMGAFSAAARVSSTLGARIPEDVQVFPGPELELYLAHVGESVALLAAIPKRDTRDAVALIRRASADLRRILIQIGVPPGPVEEPPPPAETPGEAAAIDPATALEMENLFEEAGELALTAEEIDAFWDTPEKNMNTGSLNPDDLSYDQARRIGLAPEEE